MMQVLLEDRFQLKIHRQTSEGPVYLLSVARGGPKLHPFTEGSCTPYYKSHHPRFSRAKNIAGVMLSAGSAASAGSSKARRSMNFPNCSAWS